MNEQPKRPLIDGFRHILDSTKDHANKLRGDLRKQLLTWKPSEKCYTKKPINRKARRKKVKAQRQARKFNRRKDKRPKGY